MRQAGTNPVNTGHIMTRDFGRAPRRYVAGFVEISAAKPSAPFPLPKFRLPWPPDDTDHPGRIPVFVPQVRINETHEPDGSIVRSHAIFRHAEMEECDQWQVDENYRSLVKALNPFQWGRDS